MISYKKSEILKLFSKILNKRIEKIEMLGDGIAYSKIIFDVYSDFPIKKINTNPENEIERKRNLEIIRDFLIKKDYFGNNDFFDVSLNDSYSEKLEKHISFDNKYAESDINKYSESDNRDSYNNFKHEFPFSISKISKYDFQENLKFSNFIVDLYFNQNIDLEKLNLNEGSECDSINSCDEYISSSNDCIKSGNDGLNSSNDCINSRNDCIKSGNDCIKSGNDGLNSSNDGINLSKDSDNIYIDDLNSCNNCVNSCNNCINSSNNHINSCDNNQNLYDDNINPDNSLCMNSSVIDTKSTHDNRNNKINSKCIKDNKTTNPLWHERTNIYQNSFEQINPFISSKAFIGNSKSISKLNSSAYNDENNFVKYNKIKDKVFLKDTNSEDISMQCINCKWPTYQKQIMNDNSEFYKNNNSEFYKNNNSEFQNYNYPIEIIFLRKEIDFLKKENELLKMKNKIHEMENQVIKKEKCLILKEFKNARRSLKNQDVNNSYQSNEYEKKLINKCNDKILNTKSIKNNNFLINGKINDNSNNYNDNINDRSLISNNFSEKTNNYDGLMKLITMLEKERDYYYNILVEIEKIINKNGDIEDIKKILLEHYDN
ncbi:hypothetical protein DMUE_3494 [Dictyocoela muelleri]|nr:hypothetical protein DMUE_3494 [Dictyocoela muelleri]